MNILKKSIIAMIASIISITKVFAINTNISQSLQSEVENLNLDVKLDSSVNAGEDLSISLIISSSNDLCFDSKNNNLVFETEIDDSIFKFVKSKFSSECFKVHVSDDKKKLIFSLKKGKKIDILKESENEILSFNLKTKEEISDSNTNIVFNIKTNDREKSITKSIFVVKKVPEIKNISSENGNYKIDFDKNKKKYKISVPADEKSLDLKVTSELDDEEDSKLIHTKLGSSGTSTIVKIGDYEVEIYREEKSKKESKSNSNEKKQKKNSLKKEKSSKSSSQSDLDLKKSDETKKGNESDFISKIEESNTTDSDMINSENNEKKNNKIKIIAISLGLLISISTIILLRIRKRKISRKSEESNSDE